jgi:hypothetical protein
MLPWRNDDLSHNHLVTLFHQHGFLVKRVRIKVHIVDSGFCKPLFQPAIKFECHGSMSILRCRNFSSSICHTSMRFTVFNGRQWGAANYQSWMCTFHIIQKISVSLQCLFHASHRIHTILFSPPPNEKSRINLPHQKYHNAVFRNPSESVLENFQGISF